MTRHKARECAFELVFEKSFREEDMDQIILEAVDLQRFEEDPFLTGLAKGVASKEEELDALIERYSIKWNTNRISRVALSLLRIACYEILYREEIPVSVSINEAVELAKLYGGEEDSSFINGILGSIVRERAPE